MSEIKKFNNRLQVDAEGPCYKLGDWGWVKSSNKGAGNSDAVAIGDKQEDSWFGCIVKIGSNFIELEEPMEGSARTARIHFDDVEDSFTLEDAHQEVIAKTLAHYKEKVNETNQAIVGVASELSLIKGRVIENNKSPSTSLSTIVDHGAPERLKTELITAKDETLPALKEQQKEYMSAFTKWSKAEMLSINAQMADLEQMHKIAEDRVFDITIYAGIGETVKKIKDGSPANASTPLHVFQRKLFMDETALIDYDVGGMEFDSIEKFDEWICRTNNLNSVFSHPRSIVAFQVRRHKKERSSSSFIENFINVSIENADKKTFLYVRNGECVYRVDTELEFDDMLFPTDLVGVSEPAMVKMFCRKVDEMITVRDYDQRVLNYHENKKKEKAWALENPEESAFRNPYRAGAFDFRPSDFSEFTPKNVYYDEIRATIEDKIKAYNRVALILQGLFDRSDILHPSPRVNLSNPQDFNDNIKLVMDAENVLYAGGKPDFKAYLERCNKSASTGCVFVGQHELFVQDETDKENDRRDRSRYAYDISEAKRYIPPGNGGPGLVSIAERVFSGKVRFSWKKRAGIRSNKDYVRATLTVPLDKVLNACAYKKGDYKLFLSDPRSREEYMQWAPLLLAAEEFVTGKRKPVTPDSIRVE